MRGKEKANTGGFTLFELLLSISIIAILISVAMVGLSKVENARSLDSAQSQLHALLRVARSQAILNGTESRLIINFDETDQERFLRFAGVVVKDREEDEDVPDVDGDGNPILDGDGNQTSTTVTRHYWKAAHEGTFLPQGVYVVPQSKVVAWAGADQKSDYIGTEEYVYPRKEAVAAGTGEEWIYCAFTPGGKLTSGAAGAHFVLGEGNYGSGGLTFADQKNVSGIRIRGNGNSFSVDDPAAFDDT